MSADLLGKPIVEFLREEGLSLVFRVTLPPPFVMYEVPVPVRFTMPTPGLDKTDAGSALKAAEAFAKKHKLDPLAFFHDVLDAFTKAGGTTAISVFGRTDADAMEF